MLPRRIKYSRLGWFIFNIVGVIIRPFMSSSRILSDVFFVVGMARSGSTRVAEDLLAAVEKSRYKFVTNGITLLYYLIEHRLFFRDYRLIIKSHEALHIPVLFGGSTIYTYRALDKVLNSVVRVGFEGIEEVSTERYARWLILPGTHYYQKVSYFFDITGYDNMEILGINEKNSSTNKADWHKNHVSSKSNQGMPIPKVYHKILRKHDELFN